MKNDIKKSINNELNEVDWLKHSTCDLSSERKMMKKFIKLNNRPDFYYVCSDKLKKDYDFIIFLLNYIKNITFDDFGKVRKRNIMSFVETDSSYKNNNDEEFNLINNKREVDRLLNLIISNYINDENNQKYRKKLFSVAADSIKVLDSSYPIHSKCNEICKLQLDSELENMEKLRDEAKKCGQSRGLGFYYIRNSYNHYDNILEIFAKLFINKIFSSDYICLEKEIHKEFQSAEHLINYDVVNYLLNYISHCDESLYAYLYARPYLLKDKCDEILRYINNWDIYVSRDKIKRYRLVFAKLREYIYENVYIDTKLSELDIVAYVIKELGLPESIFIFDGSNEYVITREVIKNINYDYIKEHLNKSYACRMMYDDIKRIFIETLKLEEKEKKLLLNPSFDSARNDLTFIDRKTRCKIIKYNQNKHHNND